ncbi:MAG: CotH kinase family protein [Planctomycetes bacterium]|nr:CotH kinase family protein [Planctomycetota bacterium]
MRLGTIFLGAVFAGAGCLPDGGGRGGGGGGLNHPNPVQGSSSELFDERELHEIHLTMSQQDWDSIIQDNNGDTYRQATFRWKDYSLDGVGVRPSGEWSRYSGNRKQSLRVQFDQFADQQRFLGLRTLKLDGMINDPSFMRDRISYGVYRQHLVAPRAAHGRLYVNGEYRGVYLIEERVDGHMMRNRFDGEVGNLYRILSSQIEPYAWQGTDVAMYVPFPWAPRTHEQTGEHSAVPAFVQAIQAGVAELERICDVDALLALLAVEVAITNTDAMAGNFGPNNHYQYYRFETGKFLVIPWDADGTWWDVPDRPIFTNFQQSRLTALVENDAQLRARLLTKIGEVIESSTHPDTIHARVETVYAQIREAVEADPNKQFTMQEFEWSRDLIKSFATDRYAFLQARLEDMRGGSR